MSLGQLFGKPSRVVLLHYHIFKNAGTTIDFVLRQNFGDKLVYLHGDKFDSFVSDAEILDFVRSNPAVAAISSHHMRPPSPDSREVKFLAIIILREPLDRLCSIYDFYRRSDQDADPLSTIARNTDIAEFIRALREGYPHLLQNPQLNFVANQGRSLPTPDDLARGVALITNTAILGTTELLSEALAAAECGLRRESGKLDLSYMSQNVTMDRPRAPAAERLRDACGAEFYNEICHAVELDAELHRRATEEVRRRVQQIADREKRLENFRARCRQHQRNAEMIIAASHHPYDFVRFLS